jgi:hypothetical protein
MVNFIADHRKDACTLSGNIMKLLTVIETLW